MFDAAGRLIGNFIVRLYGGRFDSAGDFMAKAGLLGYPIVLCSVAAVAITLERTYRFHKAKVKDPQLITKVKDLILEGKLEEARELTRRNNNDPVASILHTGLSKHLDVHCCRELSELEKALSHAGAKEIQELERFLPTLATIVNVSPLLGLFGTITGLIKAFQTIQDLGGKVNALVLAGGIWEAMLTTAMGLTVAVPAALAYNYFTTKVNQFASEMTDSGMELIEAIKRREHLENQQHEHNH